MDAAAVEVTDRVRLAYPDGQTDSALPRPSPCGLHASPGVALLSALALLASSFVQNQDKDKAGPETKPTAKGQVPMYWDQLGLTDAQRAEVVKLTRDQRDKVDKRREEVRNLDEYARKRLAILTDEQRKKMIDLVAGEARKDKDGATAKDK